MNCCVAWACCVELLVSCCAFIVLYHERVWILLCVDHLTKLFLWIVWHQVISGAGSSLSAAPPSGFGYISSSVGCLSATGGGSASADISAAVTIA